MLAVELCREFASRLQRALEGGAGAAAIMRAFDSTLPAAVAALPLAAHFSRGAVRDAVACCDGVQPFLASPEAALRQLVEEAVELFVEPAEACLEAVHAAVAAAFTKVGGGAPAPVAAQKGEEGAHGDGSASTQPLAESWLDADAAADDGGGVLRRYPHAHARLAAAARASLDEHKATAAAMLRSVIESHRKYPTPRFFRTRPLQLARERPNAELERAPSSRLGDGDSEEDDGGEADDMLSGLAVEEDESAFEDTTGRQVARRASMAGSRLTGYLSKHSEKEAARESWQRRYFVLDEPRRTLWYFADARASHVRGEIAMADVVVADLAAAGAAGIAEADAGNAPRYENSELMIALAPKDERASVGGRRGRLILKAESPEQKREWLMRLKKVDAVLNPAAGNARSKQRLVRSGQRSPSSGSGSFAPASSQADQEDAPPSQAPQSPNRHGWVMPSGMSVAEREEFMYGAHVDSNAYGGEVLDHACATGRSYMDHTAAVLLHSVPKIIVFFLLEPVKKGLMGHLFKDMCKAADETVPGPGGIGEEGALTHWATEGRGWQARREEVARTLQPLRAARSVMRALLAHARESDESHAFGRAASRDALANGGDQAFERRESGRLQDQAREERTRAVVASSAERQAAVMRAPPVPMAVPTASAPMAASRPVAAAVSKAPIGQSAATSSAGLSARPSFAAAVAAPPPKAAPPPQLPLRGSEQRATVASLSASVATVRGDRPAPPAAAAPRQSTVPPPQVAAPQPRGVDALPDIFGPPIGDGVAAVPSAAPVGDAMGGAMGAPMGAAFGASSRPTPRTASARTKAPQPGGRRPARAAPAKPRAPPPPPPTQSQKPPPQPPASLI